MPEMYNIVKLNIKQTIIVSHYKGTKFTFVYFFFYYSFGGGVLVQLFFAFHSF